MDNKTIKITILIFVLTLLFTSGGQASEFDNRPFLFFDGKRFADAIASNVCKNPKSLNFKQNKNISTLVEGFDGWTGSRIVAGGLPSQEQSHLLEAWILSQPDNSITPMALMMDAVEISHSNVLDALRLIYNLLSDGWSDKKKFLKRPIWPKLIDITGEQLIARNAILENRQKAPKILGIWKPLSTRGGKASSWYHFFSTAAAAYNESSKPRSSKISSCLDAENATIGEVTLGEMVNFENFMENFRDVIWNGRADTVKRQVYDKQGVVFGSHLAANLLLAEAGKFPCGKSSKTSDYLYDAPELYGPNYPLRPGQRPDEWPK